MCRGFMAMVLSGVLVSGVLAQQPEKKSESPSKAAAAARAQRAAATFGARAETRGMLADQARDWPRPAPNARMVLIRFLIAQVTLRGDEQTPSPKPAGENRPAAEASPAKPSVLGAPRESLFDVEQLQKELQGAPIDLRSSSSGINARLSGLMKDRAVEIINRGQLTTLDGQSAFVQLGQREPRIAGVQRTPMGRSNMITMEQVGMIAAFKPYVQDNGRVSLQLTLEKSQQGPIEEGVVIAELPDGEKVRSPRLESMAVRGAVTIASGQAAALAGVNTRQSARRTEFLILVSAEVLAGE